MRFQLLNYCYFKFLSKVRGVASLKSKLGFDSKLEPGTIFIKSSLGDYSYCGYHCSIVDTEIGRFCSIANHVVIGGAGHPMHFVSTSPVFLSHKDSVKTKFAKHDYLPDVKTYIGNDVWIGDGAYIKAGVKVGNGAVIGMASVVTKDIPDYAVVAGNPAKVIRFRFDKVLIEELLASKWWLLPSAKLYELGTLVNSPRDFLNKLKGK